MMMKLLTRLLLLLLATTSLAAAQEKGTLHTAALPPLANPRDPKLPAKELFGRMLTPLRAAANAIGSYARGCLAGGVMLPPTGPNWQAMRLSRNRNWGHPNLVNFVKRLASKAPQVGWPGLLVGDMAQPRGGPMLTGHISHQIGLDADIWLTPMPARELTRVEREEMMATNVVAEDWNDINPMIWTPQHLGLLKIVAGDPEVQRVLVNPAIKKALCREAGRERGWLSKIRPVFGHNYHFHVRLHCPPDSPDCHPQAPPPTDDGCGAELAWWFTEEARKPRPPPKVVRHLTLADLPSTCGRIALTP